jgi:hypothetical protein
VSLGPAHDAEPVEPLAVLLGIAGEESHEIVEAHDIAGRLKSPPAEAGLHHAQGALALGRRELVEADAVPHDERMDVAPPPPRLALDGEERARSLLGVEGGQEGLHGIADWPGGNARLLEGEEVGHRAAVDGDPREGLRDGGLAPRAIVREKRGELGEQYPGRARRPLPQFQTGERARLSHPGVPPAWMSPT